jgi:26S proteasome regulatory subunit T5
MLIKSIAQILDMDPEAEEGATRDVDSAKKSKCAVIKTSTRQVGAKGTVSIHILLTIS